MSSQDPEKGVVDRPLALWPPRGRRDLALNVVEKTWLRLPSPSTEQQQARTSRREPRQRHLNQANHRPNLGVWDKKELRPLSWLPSSSSRHQRHLEGGSNDNDASYLVDQDGNELEPYSLAWRYLGMYMDCDVEDGNDDDDQQDEEGQNRRQRHLNSGSGDGDGDCERVVLWAAYHNPKYKGNAIGEYQFFDIDTFKWDRSTCQKRRGCNKLDCHERKTSWELVGVFKESDGLEDWAEQLFKHQAYCLWDEDTYENMQSWREQWPTECEYLEYLIDSQGNAIYAHLKPEYGGSISMGLYIDEKCSIESVNTYFDYINAYYVYYVSEDQAEEAVEEWINSINAWNDAMDVFKICQPCRSYSLSPMENEQEQGSGDERLRFLENNEYDGEGGEEPNGYNCYDDAGYTNCNQCYKFESQTDMEAASTDDLARATGQGSILRVNVDGATYGHGGFRHRKTDFGKLLAENEGAIVAFCLIVSTVSIAFIMLLSSWRKTYKHSRNKTSAAFNEKFLDTQDTDEEPGPRETEIVETKSKRKSKNAIPFAGRRAMKTATDDKVDSMKSSSFSDDSVVSDPGHISTDKFVKSFTQQITTFLSVWKKGIKGALHDGGVESSFDESRYEGDDDDEYSESLGSKSTITESSFVKAMTNNAPDNRRSRISRSRTEGGGYVPPQSLYQASQFLFARTVQQTSNDVPSDEDDATENIESDKSASSGSDIEQFYDELSDKILSEQPSSSSL